MDINKDDISWNLLELKLTPLRAPNDALLNTRRVEDNRNASELSIKKDTGLVSPEVLHPEAIAMEDSSERARESMSLLCSVRLCPPFVMEASKDKDAILSSSPSHSKESEISQSSKGILPQPVVGASKDEEILPSPSPFHDKENRNVLSSEVLLIQASKDSVTDDAVCVDCENGVCDSCPLHLKWKRIRHNFKEDPNKLSVVPVPKWASVSKSSIPDAGLGVFALKHIAYGVRIGPYQGLIRDPADVSKEEDMSYMWEVKENGKVVSVVDGSNAETSNFLRYINCACTESQQNLVAYQYKRKIYYRTVRNIKPGEELLVWYGQEYAENLGIMDVSMSLGPRVSNKPMSMVELLSAEVAASDDVPPRTSSRKRKRPKKLEDDFVSPSASPSFRESLDLILSSKKTVSPSQKISLHKASPVLSCVYSGRSRQVAAVSPYRVQASSSHPRDSTVRKVFATKVKEATVHVTIVPHLLGPVHSYKLDMTDGQMAVSEKTQPDQMQSLPSKRVKKSLKHRCPLCPELLSSPGMVYHHIKKLHSSSHVSKARPYYCAKCRSWHKSAFTLWNHLRAWKRRTRRAKKGICTPSKQLTPGRRKWTSAVQPLQPVTVVPLSSDTETIDIITP